MPSAARWAKVPTEILTMIDLTASERLVYVALCAHANASAECYPSRETIGKFTGLSIRTISSALASLTDKGIIERQERSGTTPLYIVCALRDLHGEKTDGKNTPANTAPPTISSARDKQALESNVKRLFFDVFHGHGVGNAAAVQRYIYESDKPLEWYSALFERASKLPFLCGANARRIKMPLSFILREGENILERGKYAPWKDKAAQVAEYLKKEGLKHG